MRFPLFALFPLAFLPLLAAAGDAQEEAWGARFQTTYSWQAKPAFPAAYSGPNSLSARRDEAYTFTATAHLGFRPWNEGEIYLNPEISQGVPFSGLTGLGGFPNGEATRASGSTPVLYRQRLFLRQTWNLGGDREAVESDFNQLAGAVDSKRFVLTAGNFSTLDVFDKNAYAHDPRSQFMNWSNMTHASFDYAADARGFGWGFAGEWYEDDWVLRFGRMTPPKEPNMLPLDLAFLRHYGDQIEVEHAHQLAGQPGKLRLLAFRNRAVLARYRDAIDYGTAHGEAPDIFKVRNGEQIKYGLGVNVEQAISSQAGIFLRAMQADGHSETLAFTEADQSAALGMSIKGAAWGRAQDTFGLALARNGLSRDRRDYLAAGGISFFIGDGALGYRPETIVESYYSWNPMKGAWLSANYQHLANPAYNAERGPVNIYGLRLHLEYP